MVEYKVNTESFIEYISVLGIIVGIALGIQYRYEYFILSLLFFVILIVTGKVKRQRLAKYYRNVLNKQWAKEHKAKRDMHSIRELYDFTRKRGDDHFIIDDITWRDLNMDSVFARIDHTKSMPGKNYLYNILRNPVFDKIELSTRSHTIDALLDRKDISQSIQMPLYILGMDKQENIFSYFKDGINMSTKYLTLYRILSYLSYLSLGLILIDRQLGFTALILMLLINGGIYHKNKFRIYDGIEIFKSIGNLIGTAERIVKIDTCGIDIGQDDAKGILKHVKRIHKNISALKTTSDGTTELELIIDYINMITLRETVIFYKTIDLVNKYREEIFEIYNYLGSIDFYTSIASYKDGLSFSSRPKFMGDNKGFYLAAEELYHPLLDNPVAYTFRLDNKGALITGSNASGKSTYLRTIGINAIFAQSIHMVLGRSYCASYFRVLTSIGTVDSIVEGDSYFMAEAKSLKRVIDILDNDSPVLCILDEIFRGTNTAERISAAREVLDYMIDRNSCVIAATHDIELTDMVGDRFKNYHFREIIQENDIDFDYILRSGPCTSRNAIAILRYLGYPKEIYKNAINRI